MSEPLNADQLEQYSRIMLPTFRLAMRDDFHAMRDSFNSALASHAEIQSRALQSQTAELKTHIDDRIRGVEAVVEQQAELLKGHGERIDKIEKQGTWIRGAIAVVSFVAAAGFAVLVSALSGFWEVFRRGKP